MDEQDIEISIEGLSMKRLNLLRKRIKCEMINREHDGEYQGPEGGLRWCADCGKYVLASESDEHGGQDHPYFLHHDGKKRDIYGNIVEEEE